MTLAARPRLLTAIHEVITADGEFIPEEDNEFQDIKRLFEGQPAQRSRRRADPSEDGVTVMKPVSKPEAHEKYQRLIEAATAAGSVSTAVAHPCDEVSLKGAVEAARLRLIDPILVGPAARIRSIASQYDIDIQWPEDGRTRCTVTIPRQKLSSLCATAKPKR